MLSFCGFSGYVVAVVNSELLKFALLVVVKLVKAVCECWLESERLLSKLVKVSNIFGKGLCEYVHN